MKTTKTFKPRSHWLREARRHERNMAQYAQRNEWGRVAVALACSGECLRRAEQATRGVQS